MPELVVMVLVGGVLFGLLLPALAKARARAKLVRDMNHLRQIHQGIIVWSLDSGTYPTPGLVNRLGTMPGIGDEDVMINTTDNMFSLMIAMNLIQTEVCVSPVESSGHVTVDGDYNWDKINIPIDVYWDDAFDVDLDGSDGGVCNSSYAHTLIAGERQSRQWRNTANSMHAVIGNRGVENGSTDPAEYFASNTLRFHGGRQAWVGNICFADNHVETFDTFTPIDFSFDEPGTDRKLPDNFYANDTDPEGIGGIDNWLTMCSAMLGNWQARTIVLEWD